MRRATCSASTASRFYWAVSSSICSALALVPLAPVVVLARAGHAVLHDGGDVQCVVEPAVAVAVEPVPVVVPGRHVDWCGAGVAGEVVPAGEPADVADLGALLSHSQPATPGRGSTPLMSHTKTAGSQLPSYPTGRLTHSLAGPRATASEQVASSATSAHRQMSAPGTRRIDALSSWQR